MSEVLWERPADLRRLGEPPNAVRAASFTLPDVLRRRRLFDVLRQFCAEVRRHIITASMRRLIALATACVWGERVGYSGKETQ